MNTNNTDSTKWWIEYEAPSIEELTLGVEVSQGATTGFREEDLELNIDDGDDDPTLQ